LTAAASVTGAGTVIFDSETFNGMTITVVGTYNVTGTTIFQATNRPFAFPSVEFDGDTTMGTLNLGASTLSGVGDVTVTGTLNWTEGTMSGLGNTNVNGSMLISSSASKALDGRTLNNAGTVTWNAGAGDVGASNEAVFNNLSGAVFDMHADATFGNG